MPPLRESGLILFASDYAASVAFYRDRVGLRVRFEKENLTCFQFGGSYLLVEPRYGEEAVPAPNGNSPVWRLNVDSIDEVLAALRARGLAVEKMEFEWGTTVSLRDPDGYMVEWCQWPESLYRDHPPLA
ncbi:MAG TPA: VOC family protein [bacterium]|nr:VOC family protein [bacterium]